jgi:putative ATP-dependent endonuclease of OLD family
LRDAERSLSSGRGSRLAQILRNKPEIKSGIDECDNSIPLSLQELSVLGIDNLINNLLEDQTGIKSTKEDIDKNLTNLSIKGDNLNSSIRVGQAAFSEDRRLREMLEKLDLKLVKKGKPGLGSNNLLFMACELLLL